MAALRDITREAFHVEEGGIDWRSGVAGALVAVGPLAIGLALDEPAAGFGAAIGGLNTALGVPRARLGARLFWGGLALVGGIAAVGLAHVAEGSTGLLVALTVAWVAVWALWRAAGPVGALVGFATAAVFVITAGLPTGGATIGEQMLWFALGGVPSLALMVLARRGGTKEAPTPRAAWHAYTHPDGTLLWHAGRLAGAVALGTIAYRVLKLEHGYWVPLTTLAILQPGVHATRVRAIQRAAGTLGSAAVIALIVVLVDASALLLACAAASAFGLYALDRRGYFWLVVLLTPTVLFMISAVTFTGDAVALDRVADSSIGIVIGLLIGEAADRLKPPAHGP